MDIDVLAEDVHRLSTENLATAFAVLTELGQRARRRGDRRAVVELEMRRTLVEDELGRRQLSFLQESPG